MAEAPGNIEEQRARLSASLLILRGKVLGLPKTIPIGTPEGPIARFFGDFAYDAGDGPYEALDRAWTRTFKAEYTQVEREALVLGGEYGVRMVYTYFSHFSKLSRMEEHDGLNVLYLRVTQLLELIENVSVQRFPAFLPLLMCKYSVVKSPHASESFYALSNSSQASKSVDATRSKPSAPGSTAPEAHMVKQSTDKPTASTSSIQSTLTFKLPRPKIHQKMDTKRKRGAPCHPHWRTENYLLTHICTGLSEDDESDGDFEPGAMSPETDGISDDDTELVGLERVRKYSR
jgi:hypothetical protein